jgi:hypothetical protein
LGPPTSFGVPTQISLQEFVIFSILGKRKEKKRKETCSTLGLLFLLENEFS